MRSSIDAGNNVAFNQCTIDLANCSVTTRGPCGQPVSLRANLEPLSTRVGRVHTPPPPGGTARERLAMRVLSRERNTMTRTGGGMNQSVGFPLGGPPRGQRYTKRLMSQISKPSYSSEACSSKRVVASRISSASDAVLKIAMASIRWPLMK